MTTHLITISHARADILEHGVRRAHDTLGDIQCEKWIINHHWPLNYWETSHAILNIAERYGYRVFSPPRNLGGHDGFSWAVHQIGVQDDDLVIGMDPDSNPYTPGWGDAMVEVMKDPKMACASLLHDHIVEGRPWSKQVVNGHTVATLQYPEMQNISAWSGKFLRLAGGLKGSWPFYGGIEPVMHKEAEKHGMIHGYLWDYRETVWACNIDREYSAWKHAHISGDPRNFDQYVKDLGLE